MKVNLSSQQKSFYTFVAGIFLVGSILLVVFVGYVLQRQKRTTLQTQPTIALKKQPIVETPASPETTTSTKAVAAKLNLQRKIIVPSSPDKITQIQNIIRENGGKIQDTHTNLIVAEIPKESERAINESLQMTQSVQSIEVDQPIFLTADTPDWGIERIKAPDVWETTSAEGIRIAVIDTGIDYNHPDLINRYGGGYDTVNEDTDPADDHGHGTHVSGIVASDLNNSGIAGAAPKAQIVAVKTLASDGTGYMSDLIEAIDWAINNNVSIINLSLGASSGTQALEDKINQATTQGIVIVAAAGNTNGGALLYPAAYSNVISVAATDSNDQLASFSSLGAEIAAPGVAITSTIPGGGYATWSGTSMASPHVAATVALMIANNQTTIRQNLQNTAIDLGPTGKDNYYGYGLVHAKPAALGEDLLAPLVTVLSPEHESTVNGSVNIDIDVQDENTIDTVDLLINNQLIKQWTEEPFSYTWDTTALTQQEYEILVKATDEYENIGEAKIRITVSDESPTPTASVSASVSPEQGNSSNVRQDTDQAPAQENRKDDENRPGSPNEAQEKGAEKSGSNKETSPEQNDTNEQNNPSSESVPDVTNLNQRNQKSEALAPPGENAVSSNNNGNGKGKVKGLSSSNFFETFLQSLSQLFK